MKHFKHISTCKNVEKHEYLEFQHRPSDKKLVESIQNWCIRLARRESFTRSGRSDSRLNLKMTITVDGERYSSNEIAELYEGIFSLAAADSFCIDSETDGREGEFVLQTVKSEDGGILDRIVLDDGPELESIVAKAMNSEDFIYKCIEFLPDHGEIRYAMIKNGSYVDLDSRMSADILESKSNSWWSWMMYLGVKYPERDPKIDEQIKQIVYKSFTDDEIASVKERWDEAMADDECYTAVMNGLQWNDGLNSLEAFLCELNKVFSENDDVIFCGGDNVLVDKSGFGVAKIQIAGNVAHVVGTYF